MIVIEHPEKGIFIGSFLGLGFWSKLDYAGSDRCVAFDSVDEAKKYVMSWESHNNPNDYSYPNVETKVPGIATAEECVKAGLEGWGKFK